MSALLTIQLCAQYIERFGHSPKPTQLIRFAKQNGVKLLYKNVTQAIKSITTNMSSHSNAKKADVNIDNAMKPCIESTVPSQNKTNNHQSKTNSNVSTKPALIYDKCTEVKQHKIDQNYSEKSTKVSVVTEVTEQTEPEVCPVLLRYGQTCNKPNNSVLIEPNEIKPNNALTKISGINETENDTKSDLKYQIIVRRKHKLDIIIYIDSCTSQYSFTDYQTYLRDQFDLIITPTFSVQHSNYNIMDNFSPICHRLITNITQQKLCDDPIKLVVFGFIRNETLNYKIYIPSEILLLMVSYLNQNDKKFTNPTHYQMQECPTKEYKYGLFQTPLCWNYICDEKANYAPASIPIKISTEYHSKYNNNSHNKHEMACNVCILPLNSGSIEGIAPCNKIKGDDIINEALKYYRANVFKKNFEVYGSADLILIYLTLFITYCLNELSDFKNKNEAINCKFYMSVLNGKKKCLIKWPGDNKFPFKDKMYCFMKPKSQKEKHIFVEYFKQLRGETLRRLLNMCYHLNDLQNKHWFQFSKRKFLNININEF